MIPTRYLQKTSDGVFVEFMFRNNRVEALYIPSTRLSETPIYNTSQLSLVDSSATVSRFGIKNTAQMRVENTTLPRFDYLSHTDWFLPSLLELRVVLRSLTQSPVTMMELSSGNTSTIPSIDSKFHYLSSTWFTSITNQLRVAQIFCVESIFEVMQYNRYTEGRYLPVRSVTVM